MHIGMLQASIRDPSGGLVCMASKYYTEVVGSNLTTFSFYMLLFILFGVPVASRLLWHDHDCIALFFRVLMFVVNYSRSLQFIHSLTCEMAGWICKKDVLLMEGQLIFQSCFS